MFKNHDPTLEWEDADILSEIYLTNHGFAGMILNNKKRQM